MSELNRDYGSTSNGRNPFSLCRCEAKRLHAEGSHEPYESRGSRTDLWGTGGEIPPVYPAMNQKKLLNDKVSPGVWGLPIILDNRDKRLYLQYHMARLSVAVVPLPAGGRIDGTVETGTDRKSTRL